MSEILRVNNLTKNYGSLRAVKQISFTLDEGMFFSFLGHNGAGKTTTIRMISTLLSKTEGDVFLNGFELGVDDDSIRKSIGVVFQESLLDKELTVEENMKLRASFYRMTDSDYQKSFDLIDSKLNISDIYKQKYGSLSGGQKRKIDIAYAIINPPRLLILDEPTTGLDPETRVDVWRIIKELQHDLGITIFLTTHYMEEARDSDKIIIIEKGEICAEGTPDELREKYSYASLILTSSNIIELENELKSLNHKYSHLGNKLRMKLKSTTDALPILNQLKTYTSFEVLAGNMDDVFLNATKEVR
jgi:multidrug/hemolysin transport system ATP-binding protein